MIINFSNDGNSSVVFLSNVTSMNGGALIHVKMLGGPHLQHTSCHFPFEACLIYSLNTQLTSSCPVTGIPWV